MMGALIVVFREAIEAGLIVGIVLAATQGVPGRGRWVALGLVGGLAGAALVAAFAGLISEAFQGSGQELLNAGVLLLAVVMLTWHNVWMAKHGREMATELRAVGHAVSTGQRSLLALAVVVGVAVLREGAEVVLFLYGIVASGTSGADLMLGGVLGLLAGAVLSGISYAGLLTIPTRYIFQVTSVLLGLLAAGLAAQAVQFLAQAGIANALTETVWDTSWLLSENSVLGRILHTLIGYTDQPTQMQLVVYLAVIAATFALTRFAAPTASPRPVAV